MKKLVIELCCVIALAACGNGKEQKTVEEDAMAKALLQGVWINDETELPLMRIEGDTIYRYNNKKKEGAKEDLFKMKRDGYQNRRIIDLFSIGFAVCTLSGIACFWLFFKCIDWFEKI